jgi:hypothetical protein
MNLLFLGIIIILILVTIGVCLYLYIKGFNKKKLAAIGASLTIILASIPVILNAPPALGKTFYVSVTGSDSNDGTTPYNDHAFKTPQKAFNVTASGDTVKICPGTYVIRGGAGHSTLGSYVFWNRTGTGGNWFTIRDNGNGTVIFDGTTCPSGEYNAILRFYDPRYIRITGITFNHSYRNALTFQRDSTYYPSFITIDNCSITNCSQAMIYIVSGNNVTIENNYVYNNFNNWTGTLSPKITGEVISLPNAADYDINNNTMMNNRFINIDLKGTVRRANVCYNRINTTAFDYVIDYWGIKSWGESAIYIDTQGANAYNITIHHNFIYGNCTGININNEGATGHYEYVYIHDNIINVTRTPFGNQGYYTTRCPVYLGNEGAALATMYHDIFIYSNTLCTGNDSPEDDNFPCILFGRRPGGATLAEFTSANLDDVVVVNNVLYTADSSNTSTGYLMMSVRNITWAEAANIFTVNNNSFYRTTNSINIWWGSTKYYYPSYATYFGGEATFTDPAFVTRAEQYADFHLTSSSPCVNSGNNTFYSKIDFDGVSRPQNLTCDIGAYEYHPTITPVGDLIETVRVISHGLGTTPDFIAITPTSYPGSYVFFYVDTITTTTFTLHMLTEEGVNVSFMWKAEKI